MFLPWLQLLSVLRGDRRFEEAYNEKMKEGDGVMCEMLDRMEEKGEVKMLASLVRKGKFTIQQAAEELSVTADAFVEKRREYNVTIF